MAFYHMICLEFYSCCLTDSFAKLKSMVVVVLLAIVWTIDDHIQRHQTVKNTSQFLPNDPDINNTTYVIIPFWKWIQIFQEPIGYVLNQNFMIFDTTLAALHISDPCFLLMIVQSETIYHLHFSPSIYNAFLQQPGCRETVHLRCPDKNSSTCHEPGEYDLICSALAEVEPTKSV